MRAGTGEKTQPRITSTMPPSGMVRGKGSQVCPGVEQVVSLQQGSTQMPCSASHMRLLQSELFAQAAPEGRAPTVFQQTFTALISRTPPEV